MEVAGAIRNVDLVADKLDAEGADVLMVAERSEDTNVCAKVACELESHQMVVGVRPPGDF